MYAVKVARRAMAISCLAAMAACRTTHHSSNTATTYAHTDSAITAALAQSHIDINDDIKIDIDEWHYFPIDEWHYFPIADSQQTAAPAPRSYRHVTVTRNISSKAATTDSIATYIKKNNSANITTDEETHRQPRLDNIFAWLPAIIILIIISYIFKIFSRNGHNK